MNCTPTNAVCELPQVSNLVSDGVMSKRINYWIPPLKKMPRKAGLNCKLCMQYSVFLEEPLLLLKTSIKKKYMGICIMLLSKCTVSDKKMSLILLVALIAHHSLNCNGQTGIQTHYTFDLLDQKQNTIPQRAFNFNRAPAVARNMGFKRPCATD